MLGTEISTMRQTDEHRLESFEIWKYIVEFQKYHESKKVTIGYQPK